MLAKTVVFGLAPYTPITSHYSTTKLGKSQLSTCNQCYYGNIGMDKCLKQVTDRYGTGCTFIILSNSPERIELAVKVGMCTITLQLIIIVLQNNNYASWPLSNVSDLCSLQTMLQLGHL